MVISGGHFRPDILKPKEVVSLLLDDEELEKKCEIFIAFPRSMFLFIANLMAPVHLLFHRPSETS